MNDLIREEIYYLIGSIKDPEFPQTLDELKVVREELITVEDCGKYKQVEIQWVPTVEHCSYAF